jgi:hypothetical protein
MPTETAATQAPQRGHEQPTTADEPIAKNQTVGFARAHELSEVGFRSVEVDVLGLVVVVVFKAVEAVRSKLVRRLTKDHTLRSYLTFRLVHHPRNI